MLLCVVACALRSAGALQSAGVLSTPRPALPRSARPQAVLEHLHVLPDAAAWLEQAPSLLKHAPSLVENAPSLVEHGPSLVEHGPSLTVAAQSASGEVAQVLKDGSIVVVPKSQAGLLQGAERLETEVSALNDIGRDLVVFLAASVLVTPAAQLLRITPVLGFLLMGALIGPYGLDIFSNTEADVELGDFGIVFLLFAEGLNLSGEKIRSLAAYFPLGGLQLLLSIVAIQLLFVLAGPYLFGSTSWGFDGGLLGPMQLDDSLLVPITQSPVEAFVLGAAGALSSSAFVLPALKAKGWEERADGTAALSVLLLQDLAVAPLLVLLPLLAGQGGHEPLSVVAAKATLGFGSVVAIGRLVLYQVFELIAATRNSNTFVALTLLVAVGMGLAAEDLGLSSSTGAFAAGVLLAGTNYRAQIQADIRPFEGILLGVFFMSAGASLDPGLCIAEWPTVLAGVAGLILIKAAALFVGAAGSSLSLAESARLALLIAGGGEFAFVVFKLAEDLEVLPVEVAKVLTAIVIISMALTPLLAEVAEAVGDALEPKQAAEQAAVAAAAAAPAEDALVVCGYGEVGQSVCHALRLGSPARPLAAFDLNPARVALGQEQGVTVIYGDGSSPALLRSAGILAPAAIVVTYASAQRGVEAVQRLTAAFPASPVFTRARAKSALADYYGAGASEVVAETTEAAAELAALALQAPETAAALRSTLQRRQRQEARRVRGDPPEQLSQSLSQLRARVGEGVWERMLDESGASEAEVLSLYAVYSSLDADGSDDVSLAEVRQKMRQTRTSVGDPWSAVEGEAMRAWLLATDADQDGTVSFAEFVCAYKRSAASKGP